MKKKELKKIAEKIAENELVIRNEQSSHKEKVLAQQNILAFSKKLEEESQNGFNMENFLIVDELVQEILKKKI